MIRLRRYFISISLLLVALMVFSLSSTTSADDSETDPSFLFAPSQAFVTESRFSEEVGVKTELIPFETQLVDDPESEIGTETVVEEGKEGEKEVITTVVYYDGEEYSRLSDEVVVVEPVDRVVAHGTKIIERKLDTEHGQLTFYQKLSGFWATSYDSTCLGCSTTTATGMKQGYGVVAVDPKVIPMYTKLYVPGYGVAVAGDVGGSVKGKRIDLGFDSLNGQWSARMVDVYLLSD